MINGLIQLNNDINVCRTIGIKIKVIWKFDFENSTSNVEELDFKLKKEGYFEALSLDNSFYLFSRPNYSNKLNIYEFKSDLSFSQQEISFNKDDFLDIRDKPVQLHDILLDPIKIENNIPNSIEAVSKNVKLYNHRESLICHHINTIRKRRVLISVYV